ncbi:hypothetical protein BOTBODRAFT_34321 [Botryobasidium botryosum FD-172 SS1]|uniref:C2H2-type domain-containing protein n=1 Tax=Botryobasidium botryosum (strain FD-172 SS1) TaxID=930990 RepID=A0A067ML31_BOTB1|nr:hypothetical protein BOTBODRAFT_34321 [Botryobasidium botryosum FD-172 SS1]
MPGAISVPFPRPKNDSATVSPRWQQSPMSIKMGSFGGRFYPGISPGVMMGPLDARVPMALSSSLGDEHDKLMKALGSDDPLHRDDFCRNYSCCGLDLQDLHALLEHFEEAHVVVLESPMLDPNRSINHTPAFDPDAMELDSGPSSSASSPPSTPPLTSTAAFESSIRPPPNRRMSAFSTAGSSRPGSSRSGTCTPTAEDAFNNYALYSDFSSLMPGAAPAPPAIRQPPNSKCIPPQLLYSHSAPSTAPSTPMVSRVSSPTPSLSTPHHLSHSHTQSSSHPHPPAQIQASTTLSRPASSLLLSKPFRCPTKGCNKSYKQANGLKYHITHGQCNFMPRDPSLEGLNEREADQKSRPYVCQVGSCTRRYKNMNGLRYHYQHSGAHGAVGLALLASGQSSSKDTGVEMGQFPMEH